MDLAFATHLKVKLAINNYYSTFFFSYGVSKTKTSTRNNIANYLPCKNDWTHCGTVAIKQSVASLRLINIVLDSAMKLYFLLECVHWIKSVT